MYFDRFDICEAYYQFACDWHSGMGSREYGYLARLSRIGFQPSVFQHSAEDLTENGRAIYDSLVYEAGFGGES